MTKGDVLRNIILTNFNKMTDCISDLPNKEERLDDLGKVVKGAFAALMYMDDEEIDEKLEEAEDE